MAGSAFFDTNILVYLVDASAPAKRARAEELFDALAGDGVAVISTQVLLEFFWIATRRIPKPLTPAQARQAVSRFALLPVAVLQTATVLAAAARVETRRLALWDALIIQTALDAGCDRVLTEDMQHGATIDGVRIENPFL